VIDLRIRSKITPDELQAKVGKVCTDDDYNLLLTRDTLVRKPDGSVLCVYRRAAFPPELLAASYPTLHALRAFHGTNNRGLAAGTPRVRQFAGSRTYTKNVSSQILGAFEARNPYRFCRLTAWTGRETERFAELAPLFRAIGEQFERLVPDRYAAQMAQVDRTHPEWVVPGTPFTTITVNNTYPTGVHTDKGDLDAGFSNLTVLRRGQYSGGIFLFPEYRVGVDMGDGDLLLMDAHEWHGNTALALESDDAERISVVAYFRTRMVECGTAQAEADRGVAHADQQMVRCLERAKPARPKRAKRAA
jgi:Oxygenase domain of the 2OGFeDO superfamily